ncbi:MAG: hypothetical protein BVN33_04925 [Proteobacteria bacterium ST_bin13]|nr:MAG: hypothetical protein BVN33_04925 [Proteobacteria bacterium ST_bin13]
MQDLILLHSHFEPHVGSDFTVVGDNGATLPLTLTAVERGRASGYSGQARDPFTLIFQSAVPEAIPQGGYVFRHAAMGEVEIFFGPFNRNDEGVQYAASFN